MSELPEMVFCMCTCRRPWYSVLTLGAMMHNLIYDGPVRWLISDGGSTQEELDALDYILRGLPHKIVKSTNLSDMVNAAAHEGTEVWFVTMDDFMPHKKINLSVDVRMMQTYTDVGSVRMGRLAFWGNPPHQHQIYADMIENGGLHWWRLDLGRTTDSYTCTIGTHLYHRRFWDWYGDIPACPPDMPGEGETNGVARFRAKPGGPTIAVPVRFGEDCGESKEPVWHFGVWRTDEYAKAGARRL